MDLPESGTYLTRRQAAEELRATGLPITESSLACLATTGRGPAYALINGRALYTRAGLAAWLQKEGAQKRCQRGRHRGKGERNEH